MPGGPFNVGSGGFPASFLSIGCGLHLVANRTQLRVDAARSAAIVTELTVGFLSGGSGSSVTLKCQTGPTITGRAAVIAVHADLAQMLNAYDRHLDLPHAGPAGPIGPAGPAGPIGAMGALGATGFTGPTGQLPTLGTPDFTSLLQTLAAALGSLGGRTPTTGRLPALPPLPTPTAPVLSRVAPGGTVNLPVVPGSTSDPSGTQVPDFPDTNRERLLEILRLLAPQIANEIAQRRAARRARALLRDQLSIFRAALAAREASLRRIAMGFGQAGTSLSLQAPARGGATPAGVGTGLLDVLIQLGTSVGGDLLSRLSLADDPEVQGPVAPNGETLEDLLRKSGGGGGAATQCGLFRGGAATRMSSRPAAVVCLPDPISGEARFFGHLGRPLVFQRDVTMAKNIPKLIRKLGGHTQHRSKR